jgi:hypothetical protein
VDESLLQQGLLAEGYSQVLLAIVPINHFQNKV